MQSGICGVSFEKPSAWATVFQVFWQFALSVSFALRLYKSYNHAHAPGQHMWPGPGPWPNLRLQVLQNSGSLMFMCLWVSLSLSLSPSPSLSLSLCTIFAQCSSFLCHISFSETNEWLKDWAKQWAQLGQLWSETTSCQVHRKFHFTCIKQKDSSQPEIYKALKPFWF